VIVNGIDIDSDALTIRELIDELDIEPRGIAVAVDTEVVRRSQWDETILSRQSRVEILTAAAGG